MKRRIGKSNLRHNPKRILVANWMTSAPTQRTLDGVLAFVRRRGLGWDVEALPKYQPDTIQLALESRSLDGVITDFDSNYVFMLFSRASIPVVFLQKDAMEPPRGLRRMTLMQVGFGDVGRAAARHFLDRRGYRSFAFVESTGDTFWSVDRGNAFRDAVVATGLPFHRFSAKGGTFEASFASRKELTALAEWLVALPKPVAVFAAIDERARDTLLACREVGLAVPRDVAILGVDDDEFVCTHVTPSLSSVTMDYESLGMVAAEELWRMIEGGKARRCGYEMPVIGVSARASTASSSVGGPLVNAALEWIEAHACEGATVADVAKAVCASRPLLDLRFRELHCGTILCALNCRRLREVQRLLRETDDSIEDVCGKAGFNDASGLRRLFHQRFGCSMREWRKRNTTAPAW